MQDSKRDTDVKNRLLDSMGEGKSGMIWENTIEASMLPHVKEMTVQVQCMKQGTQGWYAGTAQGDRVGRWVGRGFETGGHMSTHGWFMSLYGKNHCNIIK